jgi:hypothetical protein
MALDNGEGGGDYLAKEYWLGLAREGALVVFRIKRVEEPALLSTSVKTPAEPVVVDLAILNGSEEGTVYRDERIIAAGITNTLRTKTVERGGKKKKVARQPGDDVAVRMGIYKSFGSDKAGANPCGPDEFEKVKETFAKTNGDPYSHFEKRAMAELANDAEPVDASVGSGSADADDDSDLPF